MKSLTASDRKTLIRLASSLPVGDETRKALINGLSNVREAGRQWYGPKPQPAGPAKPNGNWTTKNLGKRCWSYLPESERKESDRCYTGVTEGAPGSNAGTNGSEERKKYNKDYIKRRWKDEKKK